MSSIWHIWVIKQGKIDIIRHFLETDVKAVEEVFFPTVLKEFKTGSRICKRRVPLYSGYLFLKYEDTEDNKIYYKIRSNPFVTNYVGSCESRSVEDMKKKEEWNSLSKSVGIGDTVEVMCGPFSGCKGQVNSISGNKITIKVNMFDRSIDYSMPAEDLEIVSK
jgi:transcription antitermination factor NusG